MVNVKDIKTIEDLAIIAGMPQTVKVRNHLIRYGSITSMEAIELYRITRLAAVIYLLKNKRYPLMDIETLMVYYKDGFGEQKKYAKYIFKGFKEE